MRDPAMLQALHSPTSLIHPSYYIPSQVSTAALRLLDPGLHRVLRSRLIASSHLSLFTILLGIHLFGFPIVASTPRQTAVKELWSLQPLNPRPIPSVNLPTANPIDAFLLHSLLAKQLQPLPLTDKRTWLRRVTLDLIGLPPSLEEQESFLADDSSQAYEKVVDRLLKNDQHAVRYGRHWLDILRYADWDENMPAANGLHYWRDWLIEAIKQDIPYDEFVRAQVLGNRAAKRQIISAAGHLSSVDPRPEDLFALGFLSRGAMSMSDADQQLAFSAVETISTAFLGMTMGCARCHDHFYDPISQSDYYSLKAIFDPLTLRKVDLSTPDQIFESGRKRQEYESKLQAVVSAMRSFSEPFHSRLYEERLQSFPSAVQSAVRKSEASRSAEEQKLYEDYYPILRIDPPKLKAIMPPEVIKRYDEFLRQINSLQEPDPLPVFWTVVEDSRRMLDTNYVLITGDPMRPKKSHPVQPGIPFVSARPDFRHGRRETLVDWLTSSTNPLFARVAVNRLWQWHFGKGLHASSSDFGTLGGTPHHPELLDWLASEFINHGFSMKWLHKTIVLSDSYRRASTGPKSLEEHNQRIDSANLHLWKFPLRRLEAEPIRDSIAAMAGKLDLALGGKSVTEDHLAGASTRRATYMTRGYRSFADVMPAFLQTFDAEDGRVTCSRRLQTVTAPQALWQMNSEFIQRGADAFAERLLKDSLGDLEHLIRRGYFQALGRTPSANEISASRSYLNGDPKRAAGFAWSLFNLDEFVFVP